MTNPPATVLITGANRGTGHALAKRFAELGWTVLTINRTAPPRATPGTEYRCDLADIDQVLHTTQHIAGDHPRIDALVACAAQRSIGPIASLTPDTLTQALQVNVTATFMLIHALLPQLRAASGHVVTLGSHAGQRFFEGGTAYSTSKAALRALTETLLLEERIHGVRATHVNLGSIANFDWDNCPYKMSPQSVANTLAEFITSSPADTVITELELRPARLPADQPVSGFERLRFT